jgi:hypothetical protein
LTIQPSPASHGVIDGADFMAVERHLAASRRSVLRAPRPHGLMPNWPGFEDLAPHRAASLGRDVNLEAVFAGVAGAGDARRRARNFAIVKVIADRARSTWSASATFPAPAALDRRSAHSALAKSTSRRSGCARDVLEILLLIRRVHAQEERIVGHLVHQNVVDETAVFVEQARIVRLADLQPRPRWW